MLTTINIQNFRSIRSASVKLGQVNLFIGPNNSGKSNFLKGVELFSNFTALTKSNAYTYEFFDKLLNKRIGSQVDSPNCISMQGQVWIKADSTVYFMSEEFYKNSADNRLKVTSFKNVFERKVVASHPAHLSIQENFASQALKNFFYNTVIYKIDPSKFSLTTKISIDNFFKNDGENITSFIYNLSQNNESVFQVLKDNLKECTSDLVRVAMPADPNNQGNIKLKFFDKLGRDYWAEEVSEGVLYFLALLCIVHQPDPPKLLLLEEPEKGIHPRRIREVMNFIFELARLRDIQIILTSHSPYVVDYFADIPECISVFDRKDGETVISNAAELIAKTNKEYAMQGLPPVKRIHWENTGCRVFWAECRYEGAIWLLRRRRSPEAFFGAVSSFSYGNSVSVF